MSVRIYVYGVLVGGTDPDGGTPIPAEACYGTPEVEVGAVAAGISTITFTRATKSVNILNTHDTNSFDVSFDGGVTWLTFLAYQSLSIAASVSSLLIRRTVVGDTSSYEITGILTE